MTELLQSGISATKETIMGATSLDGVMGESLSQEGRQPGDRGKQPCKQRGGSAGGSILDQGNHAHKSSDV